MATNNDAVAPPYRVETDGGYTSHYLHISLHPWYSKLSVEEIRLQDYQAGRLGPGRRATTMTSNIAMKPLFAPAPLYPMNRLKAIRASATDSHKLGHSVISFLVGKLSPEKFAIHESIIKPRSEFVRLALRGEWKEANDRTIPLPDDEPQVFSLYQEWLYSGLIYTRPSQLLPKDDDEFALLTQAFILGDKLMDLDFKDSIVDAITEKLRKEQTFDTSLTNLVWENTPDGSPLRRLWMDVYFYFGSAEWLDSKLMGEPVSSEFMVDFSRYQMQNRTGFGSLGKDAMFFQCTYHEHGLRPCYRSKHMMNWLS